MDGFVGSIVSGITTSLFWAGLVFGCNWWRNRQVEVAVRSALGPTGMALHRDGHVGLPIVNCTSIPITIRSVCIVGGRDGRARIIFDLNAESSPPGTTKDERGWVLLPPQTKATWSFPFMAEHGLKHYAPIVGIEVVAASGNHANFCFEVFH